MPFLLKNFLEELSKNDKDRLYDIQIGLFDNGFAKTADFIQMECYFEAVRILRKELNITYE